MNSVQGNMSMRSDINAHTGYFPYPWIAPEPEETIGKRIQVHDADLDPELNEGASYFVEGHFITLFESTRSDIDGTYEIETYVSAGRVTLDVSMDSPGSTYGDLDAQGIGPFSWVRTATDNNVEQPFSIYRAVERKTFDFVRHAQPPLISARESAPASPVCSDPVACARWHCANVPSACIAE